MQDPSLPSAAPSRSWIKYLIFAIVGLFLLICLSVGGIVFFVFSQLKDSEAAKLAVATLRESPVAKEKLGELKDTGWPVGNFSTDAGGSGNAAFSMSVEGSKAKGKFYAVLNRQQGIWRFQSGRLQMADGRSLDIAPPGGAMAISPASPSSPASPGTGGDSKTTAGRQLRHDGDSSAWPETAWPEQPIHFKAPPDWKQISSTRREVEYRPEDRSAYFIANATFFDQKIPYDNIFPSMLQKSANQLERGEILGYSMKRLGKAEGLFELQKRGDGQTTAVWTGYFDDEKYGTVSVTILLGAPTPEQFDKAEAQLGAILESFQVK